jgi:hypothetical protein
MVKKLKLPITAADRVERVDTILPLLYQDIGALFASVR